MRTNMITPALGPNQAFGLGFAGRHRPYRPYSAVSEDASRTVQRCSRVRIAAATASLSLQKLFGSGAKDLLATITPSNTAAQSSQNAVTALQSCLQSGTAVLIGSVAAGLHLPKFDLDVVVTLPDFSLQTHAVALQGIAAALKSSNGQQQGFSDIKLGDFSVQCRWKDLNLDILVGTSQPASPLDFLSPDLTAHQRQALSASNATATTAFLSQQPSLFKAAVRVAKHWAKVVHEKDWDGKLQNRPKSYLLALLVLKAYQQYMAAAAAGSSSNLNPLSMSSLTHDQAAALEGIMVNFLRLAAGLTSNTLLFWELQYSSEVVQQVLARPDLASVLRPKGCESHPLVLDLANPTNNVAAAVPTIERLKQVAAADLSLVEGDAIMQLQQQLVELQKSQDELKKLQVEQKRQATHMMGMIVHQQIISSCRGSTYTWSFEMPVANWLPDGNSRHVVGPTTINNTSELTLEIASQPLRYVNDQPSAGLSFKLASKGVPKLQSMIDLQLPISLTICSTSTVTLAAQKGSSSTMDHIYHQGYKYEYKTETGVLQGSSGRTFWLGRAALYKLQLVDHRNATRQQDLQCMKRWVQDYVLKFILHIQIGG